MAHILIVEDNNSLRMAYTSFLEQEHHQITAVASVPDALTFLEQNTPDVILLDMLLPGMVGLELLQQYDVITAHPTVKVIAFSNLSEMRIQEEALSLGVKLYLTKALTTPKQLVETVASILAD